MELSLRWARRCRDEFERLREPERAVRHRAGRHVRDACARSRSPRWSSSTCPATRSAASASASRRTTMRRIVAHTPHRLPAHKPRYLMGVGTPEDLVEGVAARRRHVRLRDADAQRAQRPPVHALRRPAACATRATRTTSGRSTRPAAATPARGFSPRLPAPPRPLRRDARRRCWPASTTCTTT